MKVIRKYYPLVIIISVVLISCGKKKEAQVPFEGKVTSITGAVQIFKPEASKWVNIAAADEIEFGDSIRTPEKSQVEVTFAGKNTFKIGENSKVAVSLVKDSTDENAAEGGSAISGRSVESGVRGTGQRVRSGPGFQNRGSGP